MNLHSLKSRLNDKKDCLFKGKITKSYITFCESKPNSPVVQMNVTFFISMNYPISASLTKVKNKPNQTQYKANSNPIPDRQKLCSNNFSQRDYERIARCRGQKNKPKQSQNKPNQIYPRRSHSGTQFLNSSLILSCPGIKKPDMRDILAVKFLPDLRKKYFGFYLTYVSGRAIFLFSVFSVLIYIFLEVNQWSRKSN